MSECVCICVSVCVCVCSSLLSSLSIVWMVVICFSVSTIRSTKRSWLYSIVRYPCCEKRSLDYLRTFFAAASKIDEILDFLLVIDVVASFNSETVFPSLVVIVLGPTVDAFAYRK